MPEAFKKCVKAGGKVRTKELGKGKYMHICMMNGKSYPGYVKTRKESNNSYSEALMGGMNKKGGMGGEY